MSIAREVIWFAAGGVIGLAVDASIVQILVREVGWNPYLARMPSFLAAASVTWWWNRTFSFPHRKGPDRHREWMRWIGVMSVGAAVNYGLYALLLALSASVRSWPAIGVAAGSAVAAVINFLGARRMVFTARK